MEEGATHSPLDTHGPGPVARPTTQTHGRAVAGHLVGDGGGQVLAFGEIGGALHADLHFDGRGHAAQFRLRLGCGDHGRPLARVQCPARDGLFQGQSACQLGSVGADFDGQSSCLAQLGLAERL